MTECGLELHGFRTKEIGSERSAGLTKASEDGSSALAGLPMVVCVSPVVQEALTQTALRTFRDTETGFVAITDF